MARRKPGNGLGRLERLLLSPSGLQLERQQQSDPAAHAGTKRGGRKKSRTTLELILRSKWRAKNATEYTQNDRHFSSLGRSEHGADDDKQGDRNHALENEGGQAARADQAKQQVLCAVAAKGQQTANSEAARNGQDRGERNKGDPAKRFHLLPIFKGQARAVEIAARSAGNGRC